MKIRLMMAIMKIGSGNNRKNQNQKSLQGIEKMEIIINLIIIITAIINQIIITEKLMIF